MSNSASRARQVNKGVVYTFAIAGFTAIITLSALVMIFENFLGIPFGFSFIPCILISVAVALVIRGRLGGKWMLSAFRQNQLADHRHLLMDAQANHLIDLPNESLYRYFGPSKLAKYELERLYKQALAQRDLSFKFNEQAPSSESLYENLNLISTIAHQPESQLDKPSATASFVISGRKLVKSMMRSLWQIVAALFFWKYFVLSWLGYVLVGAMLYYLFEKHWSVLRQYHGKSKILGIDERGVNIQFPEGLIQLPWRDITDIAFRNVLIEDDNDDEWMQLSTSSRGLVSLKLNLLDIDSSDEIEQSLSAWRNWAHQERMRRAMGG